jgi:hypothetical protein
VLSEEHRKPESIFDFVQGITTLARSKTHQDARLELEGKARKLLERLESNIIASSISAAPKIRSGGGRASPAVALCAAREVTQKMLKV